MTRLFRKFQGRIVRVPPVVVLLLALSLTAASTFFAYDLKRGRSEAQARDIAVEIARSIEERLSSIESALLDTRSFLASDVSLGRKAFSRFVEGLGLKRQNRGLYAVGFAQRIRNPALRSHERLIQAEGVPDYKVWPAGPRDEYISTVYWVAMGAQRERLRLGFDHSVEPVRTEAMWRAADSGLPVMSGVLKLITDPEQVEGFVVYVPVYEPGAVFRSVEDRRRALKGFVYGPVRVKDLVGPIAAVEFERRRLSRVWMSDAKGGPLFAAGDAHEAESVAQGSARVLAGGQEWTIRVAAGALALGDTGWPVHVIVFILGLLISTLIYLFALFAGNYASSLEQSQSLLSMIANSLPALVAYVGRDGRYRYVNRTYGEWFGIDLRELLGKPVGVLKGSRHERYIQPFVGRVLAGESVEFDFALERRNKGLRVLHAQYIPDRSPSGHVWGFVSLINDVTEQKAFQDGLRDERRISELVNEIGMSLQAELDPSRLSQRITDVATELTGAEIGAFVHETRREPGESHLTNSVSGKRRDEFSHLLFLPAFPVRELGRGILRVDDVTSQPLGAEWARALQGEIELRSVLAVALRSRSGEVLGGLFFGHSQAGVFTERAEKLVAGIAAQAAVAIDNAKLYSESQAINRVKDEFLATLSHELRTPLNVILGYSELLKEEELPPPVTEYVNAIHRNARAQNQLIDDLLDISAIITGKLSFQPVRITNDDVVRAAVENIRFAAEAKGVRLEKQFRGGDFTLFGDPTRIQQIVWNLLSNAVKFTPSGGTVVLETEIQEGCLVIAVRDSGVGIDAEFLPYVFDRFRQEDAGRNRRYGGLGLGLSIVRHLVELHGGNIRVESFGKNMGSCFTVVLPLFTQVKPIAPPQRELT